MSAPEETPAGLPVRPLESPEESALRVLYTELYGNDVAKWPISVRMAFAVSIATVRSYGARAAGESWQL
jgi:hypothetical protein